MKRLTATLILGALLATAPAYAQRARNTKRGFSYYVAEVPAAIWQILFSPVPPSVYCSWFPQATGCEAEE